MNTKLMASVSTLALVLSACASQEPKPLAETPEVIYKTAKVNAAVSVIPSLVLVKTLVMLVQK